MKLFEEFKLYETMWEDHSKESIEKFIAIANGKAKVYDTVYTRDPISMTVDWLRAKDNGTLQLSQDEINDLEQAFVANVNADGHTKITLDCLANTEAFWNSQASYESPKPAAGMLSPNEATNENGGIPAEVFDNVDFSHWDVDADMYELCAHCNAYYIWDELDIDENGENICGVCARKGR